MFRDFFYNYKFLFPAFFLNLPTVWAEKWLDLNSSGVPTPPVLQGHVLGFCLRQQSLTQLREGTDGAGRHRCVWPPNSLLKIPLVGVGVDFYNIEMDLFKLVSSKSNYGGNWFFRKKGEWSDLTKIASKMGIKSRAANSQQHIVMFAIKLHCLTWSGSIWNWKLCLLFVRMTEIPTLNTGTKAKQVERYTV